MNEKCFCGKDLSESGDCELCGYAPETCMKCKGDQLFHDIHQLLSRRECRGCEGGGHDSDLCENCVKIKEQIENII